MAKRNVRNIQVIDGASNTGYWIYQVSERTFRRLFPAEGQDIEFIEDVIARLGDPAVAKMMKPVWKRRIEKSEAIGVHGTLFYELKSQKGRFYPRKQEADLLMHESRSLEGSADERKKRATKTRTAQRRRSK